jgi:hypothetical protein
MRRIYGMKKILGMVLIMVFIAFSAYAGDQMCFDIPNVTVIQRVKNAYAWKYDYDSNKKPGESKGVFAKRMVKHEMNLVVDEYEKKDYDDAYATTPLREPDPNNPGEYLEIE